MVGEQDDLTEEVYYSYAGCGEVQSSCKKKNKKKQNSLSSRKKLQTKYTMHKSQRCDHIGPLFLLLLQVCCPQPGVEDKTMPLSRQSAAFSGAESDDLKLLCTHVSRFFPEATGWQAVNTALKYILSLSQMMWRLWEEIAAC